MKIYEDFREIAENFDTILVDAYGVFWDGLKLIPGAKETLRFLVQEGKQVCVLSNSSAVNHSYEKKGLFRGTHYTDVITSGDLLYHHLVNDTLPLKGHNIFVVGHTQFNIDSSINFHHVNRIEEADFVYLGTPRVENVDSFPDLKAHFFKTAPSLYDTDIIEPFMDSLKNIKELKLPVVSTNPDMLALEKGHWVIRQGTLTKVFREMGGKVLEFGKPYKEIYEFAFNKLGIKPSKKVAMIGDTFRTDIQGAINVGITPVWSIGYGVAEFECSKGISLEKQAQGALDGVILIQHL